MALALVDRFHPEMTRKQQAQIDAGKLRLLEEFEVLEPEQMRPLAWFSLQLLGFGAILFVGLNLAAYLAETHAAIGAGGWSLALWTGVNILAYIVVLPLHEGVHSLAFLFWGGRPYFGAKLPFALFCGAKNQVFRRDQYLAVGLAPLVVITLAAIVLTLLAPALASYMLLGTIGNVSGAAGDVWSAKRLLRLPREALVEDTDSGYRAWEIMRS